MTYSDSDCILGEIRLFAGKFAPQGWALCNGQVLNIQGNEALFSLIGNTYGGDGKTNFALPNLRGRVAVGIGKGKDASGADLPTTYALGATGGSYGVTLETTNLPPHTHPLYGSTSPADSLTPQSAVFATTPNGYGEYLATNATGIVRVPADANMLTALGGNQPHENMMPFLGVTYIIATSGAYPETP